MSGPCGPVESSAMIGGGPMQQQIHSGPQPIMVNGNQAMQGGPRQPVCSVPSTQSQHGIISQVQGGIMVRENFLIFVFL